MRRKSPVSNWFGKGYDCGCTEPYDQNHCQYTIWNPGHRDAVDNMAFSLFAMTTEQQERMEQVIDYLSRCPDPNDERAQNKALAFAELSFENLTNSEIKYIEEKVAERWLANQL